MVDARAFTVGMQHSLSPAPAETEPTRIDLRRICVGKAARRNAL
jgi:hypothetical protein